MTSTDQKFLITNLQRILPLKSDSVPILISCLVALLSCGSSQLIRPLMEKYARSDQCKFCVSGCLLKRNAYLRANDQDLLTILSKQTETVRCFTKRCYIVNQNSAKHCLYCTIISIRFNFFKFSIIVLPGSVTPVTPLHFLGF